MEDFSSTKRKDLVTGGPLNALSFRVPRNRANSTVPQQCQLPPDDQLQRLATGDLFGSGFHQLRQSSEDLPDGPRRNRAHGDGEASSKQKTNRADAAGMVQHVKNTSTVRPKHRSFLEIYGKDCGVGEVSSSIQKDDEVKDLLAPP